LPASDPILMSKLFNYLYLTGFHFGLGSEVSRALQFLNDSQAWDRQRLDELQSKKLQSLLENAASNTQFYGSDAYKIDALDGDDNLRAAVTRLPVLTKEIVRAECQNMRPDNMPHVFTSRTGGTTGTPLEIQKCSQGVAWALGALWRGRSFGGIGLWDRGILADGFSKPTWKGRNRLRLLRKHLLQAFGTGVEERHQFANLLKPGNVRFVEGFVTGLLEISSELPEEVHGLRAVFTTGEMLYPQQRELLRNRLNAPVYTYYGSNEIGGIAFECEHGELHVTDEHILMETLNDADDPVWEEPGRIVVTDLDNQAMPLIRYEIGDQGVLTREPCACGRSHTRLLRLCGRGQEYLDNAKGDKLPITFFAGRFRNLADIGRVQLVQHDHMRIDVLFDGDGGQANSEAQWLVREIQKGLGDEMIVQHNHVQSFHQTERGKIPLIRRMS